jgi:mono/diheme cytochrome c family protein
MMKKILVTGFLVGLVVLCGMLGDSGPLPGGVATAGVLTASADSAKTGAGPGQAASPEAAARPSTAAKAAPTAVSNSTQQDKGIGPVKELELGPIDRAMVERGKGSFAFQCAVCHSLTEKKIGPPLGDILTRRAPEFVMNMMLNSPEMEAHDPTSQRLLAQYKIAMPKLTLTKEQARDILEYLRTTAPKAKE